jgi:hypothetical protein
LGEVGFYRLLLRFEEEVAAQERALGCGRCGQVLHVADFTRKPRGVPPGLDRRISLSSLADRAAFAAWVRAAPLNIRAFLTDAMLNVELNELDAARELDLHALIAIVTRRARL